MADRTEMFGPTRGFSGMADSMEPCKMLWDRPLLMATKFGLGAEIQSPTGLFCILSDDDDDDDDDTDGKAESLLQSNAADRSKLCTRSVKDG